jgi:hypothetical protein
MRIDDVFILLPKLRPQPRISQRHSGNPRQRLALLNDMNLKSVWICGIVIRADVAVGPAGKVGWRRTLLGDRSVLRKRRGNEQNRRH